MRVKPQFSVINFRDLHCALRHCSGAYGEASPRCRQVEKRLGQVHGFARGTTLSLVQFRFYNNYRFESWIERTLVVACGSLITKTLIGSEDLKITAWFTSTRYEEGNLCDHGDRDVLGTSRPSTVCGLHSKQPQTATAGAPSMGGRSVGMGWEGVA